MASPTVDREPADAGSPPSAAAGATKRTRRPGRWLARWARSLAGTGGLRILAALAGGLALYAAFAPSTQWWSALVGFALLGLSLAGASVAGGFGLGVVFGLAFYLPLLTWSNIYVGDLPWVALSTAEALLVGPATALAAVASRRLPAWPLFAAAAWTLGEALRAVVPFGGFPWGAVAFSQPDGPLLPAAALLGAPTLGFLTALAGFALAWLLRIGWVAFRASRSSRDPGDDRHSAAPRIAVVVTAVGLLIAPFVVGLVGRAAVIDGTDAAAFPSSTIAVVQGNVPQPGLEFNSRRRAVTDLHAQQTAALAQAVRAGEVPQPKLVIWPENASDIDPYLNDDANEVISRAARDIGVPILVGAVVSSGEPGRSYNRGILWDPVTGPGEYYDKRHPVPFAEYMPYRSFFRLFSDKVDLLRGEFLAGERVGTFDVDVPGGSIVVGDVICFEVVYDRLVTDVVDAGAQVLVVQTNNATFGWTDETYQQQAMSRVRAVEHGREVLISATSGVSAVIRPDGSVESSVPLFTAGYLVPEVPLIDATTPGTVLGAPVQWGLVALTPAALLVAWLVRRRRPDPATPVPTEPETSTTTAPSGSTEQESST